MRLLAFCSLLGLVVLAGAFTGTRSRVLAQSSGANGATTPRKWVVPRTEWGDPDLEGIWPSSDMQGTPLERPASFGTRATLTDEEYAQRLSQGEKQEESDEVAYVDPKAPHPASTGPPSHWSERNYKPSRQASLIVDPANGRLPDMTPEGTKRQGSIRSTYFYDFPDRVAAHAFNSFDDFGPYDRCISRGLFGSMMPVIYNNGNAIFQYPGHVVIVNEMIHETRDIPLDGHPHLSPAIRQYLGDSRGHWEGDTLVIETTNFNGRVGLTMNGNGTPVSDRMTIVERLTRVAEDTIQYEATVDDPGTWVRSWTVSFPLHRNPRYGMFEYACHEGNYALRDILSGQRAEDRKGAK